MFSQLIKFIRVLSSDVSPLQISAGISLAMVMGLTPLLSLHNVLVVFLLLVLRVNIASFLLAWVFFSGLAYLFDPQFNQLGEYLLSRADLIPLWTDFYNQPIARLFNFNNTLVLGSLVVALLAFIPLLVIGNVLIVRYRQYIVEKFKKSRLFKFLSTSKWFGRAVSLAE